VLLTANLLSEGTSRPPRGAQIIVQVRDTTLQDAPAQILGEVRGSVSEAKGSLLASLQVPVDLPRPQGKTLWVHIDVDGDGRVSRGDYVTVRSYPIPTGTDPHLEITLKQV
jgi:uncharacterized lipoprotein YbaY